MKNVVKLLISSFLLLQGLFAVEVYAAGPNPFNLVLRMNEKMVPEQKYYSPNGRYFVVFHGDGQLVVSRTGQDVPQNVLWSNGPKDGINNAYAVLQEDSNFVIYKPITLPIIGLKTLPIFSSKTDTKDRNGVPPFVALHDDGSLGVATWGAQVKWNSPADPLASNVCGTATKFPICVFPGTMNQFNSWVLACDIADAQRQAASSGAVYGACR